MSETIVKMTKRLLEYDLRLANASGPLASIWKG